MSEAQRTDVRCVQIACTMSAQCGDVKALLPSSKEPCRPQHSHLTRRRRRKLGSARSPTGLRLLEGHGIAATLAHRRERERFDVNTWTVPGRFP